MITIGSPFALPLLSWRLYARSTTLKLADAWNDRVHDGLDVAFADCVLGICFKHGNGAHTGCIFRTIVRIVTVEVCTVPSAGTFLNAKHRRHFPSKDMKEKCTKLFAFFTM
jgi:hypothetical protein